MDTKKAKFTHYDNKEFLFWYKTSDGFEFPVPHTDLDKKILPVEEQNNILTKYADEHLNKLTEECSCQKKQKKKNDPL